MKKLLFILLLLPAWCMAQTPTTPQFKRKVPIDSLLGYNFPGLSQTYWLPDTAWIKHHISGGSGGTTIYTGDGSLAGDRVVDIGTHNLIFSGTNAFGNTGAISIAGSNDGVLIQGQSSTHQALGYFDINRVGLYYSNASSTILTGFNINSQGGLFIDSLGGNGMGYQTDYHVNGLAHFGDNWIADVREVKRLIAAGGATTLNSATFNNSGSGATSGTTFNGSTARTISYNTIGAQPTLVSGTNIKTVNSTSLLGSGNIVISGGSMSNSEIPSGTINSSNTAFTLAHTPATGGVNIFLNGQLMTPTTDYTISGTLITMINVPFTGDALLASYSY